MATLKLNAQNFLAEWEPLFLEIFQESRTQFQRLVMFTDGRVCYSWSLSSQAAGWVHNRLTSQNKHAVACTRGNEASIGDKVVSTRFSKRGVLSYPEKGSPTPPPLTLLGHLRVPTNLKASGTTLNRGSGEGVPLKGISHLFKKEQIKPCSWDVFFPELSQLILSPIVDTD